MAEFGLVLAILPLAISAAEHYAGAAHTLLRYRRFASEVSNLACRLRIQRAIFVTAIQRLLRAGIGPNEANSMLHNAQHPAWSDHGLEQFLLERLGDCRDAFVESIRMIQSRLVDMEEKCSKFEDAVDQSNENDGVDAKQWCRHVGRKIKFAFRESHFQNLFDDVRDLTEDFCALIRETDQSQEGQPASKRVSPSNTDLGKFSMVKTAARNLYEALGSACTKHTEHQVHLNLQPSYQVSAPCRKQVRFTLAFRHVLSTQDGHCNESMWFTVESMITGNVQEAALNETRLLTELKPSLKHGRASPAPPPSPIMGERQKNVQGGSPTLSPSIQSVKVDASLPNLCAHSNFCNRIAGLLSGPATNADVCVGFLEFSANSKHLVYLDSGANSISRGRRPSSPTSVSLNEMFQNTREKASPGSISMPQCDRIRLAKQLAIAALSYHATPWLNGSWNSGEIFLHGTDTANAGAMNGPYIDVSMRVPFEALPRAPTVQCRKFAPNALLFGLGVMLLELAFEAPLRALQRPIDIECEQDDRYAEFFIAKRVSRIASRQLGPKYAQIARKCLQCDFGRGDDLEDLALQQCFYQEVVCELEELETRFRNCYLGH